MIDLSPHAALTVLHVSLGLFVAAAVAAVGIGGIVIAHCVGGTRARRDNWPDHEAAAWDAETAKEAGQ